MAASVVIGGVGYVGYVRAQSPPRIAEIMEAERTGEPVEVRSARTATTGVWALPSGEFRSDVSVMPTRVIRGDEWVPVDFELRRASGGRIEPAAAEGEITLSGGGDRALSRTVIDGVSLETRWPEELPKPILDDASALYRDVAEDVDLRMTITDVGISQVLVVKSRAAAESGALEEIRQKIQTKKGTVVSERGALVVRDESGVEVGGSAVPMMWDSSTSEGPTPDVLPGVEGPQPWESPLPGSRTAQVGLKVERGTLRLRPDRDVLLGEDVTYPVYIDPVVSPTSTARAFIRKESPNTSYWNWTNTNHGFIGNNMDVWTQRMYWRFDLSSIEDSEIQRAYFSARVLGTKSCTEREAQLWKTGAIASYTDWNSTPSWQSKMGDRSAAVRPGSCNASGKELEYQTTAAVQATVNDNASEVITFGLRSGAESTTNSYMFFDKNPTLSITYNYPPNAPTGLKLVDPDGDCGTAATPNVPRVSGQLPRLSAEFRDRDRDHLKAVFTLYKGASITSGQASVWSDQGTAGVAGQVSTGTTLTSESRVKLPDANGDGRPDPGDYTWRARTIEEGVFGLDGAMSATCTFRYVESNLPTPGLTGGAGLWDVGTAKTITLTPDAASATVPPEFASYRWSLNSNSPTSAPVIPTASNKQHPLVIKPTKAGMNVLRVWSYDTSGSSSLPATLEFDAKAGTDFTARYRFDGPTGTSRDSEYGTKHLDADMAAALFGVRGTFWNSDDAPGSPPVPDDRTDHLFQDDGTTGEASRPHTSGPVLDTTKKFTVSVWVDPGTVTAEETAVSQGRTATDDSTAFSLGTGSCGTGQSCYRFGVRTGTSQTTFVTVPRSASDEGRLIHLIGDYNPGDGARLRVVVDGQVTSQRVDVTAAVLASTGDLTIGGPKGATVGTGGRFVGRIDDVTLFQGLLDDAAVVQLHARDAGRCYRTSQTGEMTACAN